MIYEPKYETMPRAELNKLQSERLTELVAYLSNQPFYKKRFKEAGVNISSIRTISDIVKLPFTVKADLRDNYPFGMFSVPKTELVRIHASSGTTGKPTIVGYTKEDLELWSRMMARCLTGIGAGKEDVLQISYGYGLFTGGLGAHDGSELLGATTIPASVGNTKRQVMLMRDMGTTVMCCTPSYAIIIAEEIEREKLPLSGFKLKSGVFGAEPWTEEMRQEIERRLNIDAYDIYGLSEIMGPGVACDCTQKAGLHIHEDCFYPEIIDPDTLEVLPEGQMGELVITTLCKQGMPLIRYRTGDLTGLNYEKCKCGRTLVRMHKLKGRTDDMIIVRGVNVFPSQIETVLLGFAGMVSPVYQIVLTRVGPMDSMEIQIEHREDFIGEISKLEHEIDKEMTSLLGLSARITCLAPNSLPRVEGKSPRVVDNRSK